MKHPLEGCLVKIERGREHLRNLREEVQGFLSTEVSTQVVEGNLYRLVAESPLPIRWGIVAGEIVQALRSALDYVAWELAILNLKGTNPSRRTQFPIAESPDSYRSLLMTSLRDLSPDQVSAIEAHQPYHERETFDSLQPLLRLRQLSNKDKHQALNMAVGRSGLSDEDLEHSEEMTGWGVILGEERMAAILSPHESSEGSGRQSIQRVFLPIFEVYLEGERIDWILDPIAEEVPRIVRSLKRLFPV